jgi:hypothetical protein
LTEYIVINKRIKTNKMEPNNTNPYPQPQSPQPQPTINGNASPPIGEPQQPVELSNRKRLGRKLHFVGRIIGLVVILLAGGILLAAHLFSNKINKTVSTLPGASSSSTPSSSSAALATSKTACQLFTLPEAQSVMGPSAATFTSTIAPPTGSGITSQCQYDNTTADGGSAELIVDTEVPSNGNMTDANNLYTSSTEEATSISGVGDRAAYDSGSQTLYAQKGNVVVTVTYTDENGNADQSIDIQIAKTMISNF